MLLLAFAEGAKADAAAVLAALEGSSRIFVSHVPDAIEQAGWAELLVDGLTYDISGFGADAETRIARPRNHFGYSNPDYWPDSLPDTLAISLGPHLRNASSHLPILRGIMEIGVALSAALPDVIAVIWRPADLAIEPGHFQADMAKWLEGGALPAQLLAPVNDALDGGLQSTGLAHFTGQELRIEPELTEDRDYAMRLASRLLGQLLLSPPLGSVEEVIGPDGNALRLEPSRNGKFVRVWRG